MWQTSLRRGACAAFASMFCVAVAIGQQSMSRERILYAFTNGTNGETPGTLIYDHAGNLYGNAFSGGDQNGDGVIFQITYPPSGPQYNVIYTFQGGPNDGSNPQGQMAIGSDGTIFGVTESGGANQAGVVFSLTPTGNTWTEKILHVFPSVPEVVNPGVIIDSAGNLYGVTENGGAYDRGVLFELKLTGGDYTYVPLYNFPGGENGYRPWGGLTIDARGNLFGTTNSGGTSELGDVFELHPNSDGTWTESVLYTFQNVADGASPQTALTFDSSGNLYGTTAYGGDATCNCGVVFELTKGGNGVWTETVLHVFTGQPSDGYFPSGAVIIDKAGNVFGPTIIGGTDNDGTIYELSPSSAGWTENIIHAFTNEDDGSDPDAPLIFNPYGDLVGTTAFGGQYYGGVVFAFSGTDEN